MPPKGYRNRKKIELNFVPTSEQTYFYKTYKAYRANTNTKHDLLLKFASQPKFYLN